MNRTILIADDHPEERTVLAGFLRDEYEVLEARSGEEAVDMLQKQFQTISAIILSAALPGTGGFETLKKIKSTALWRDIPVILATALDDEPARERAVFCGADDFVTLPFNRCLLLHTVQNAVRARETSALVGTLRQDFLTRAPLASGAERTDSCGGAEIAARVRTLEEQLRAIVNNINGGVTAALFHDDGHLELVFSNDGFYAMYGYSREQFAAEVSNPPDLILPEDRARTMETVARIVAQRGSETYEYRCHRRDGSIVWVRCTNSVISLPGVGETVLLAVSSDITDLRASQQENRKTMDRLQNVMDAMSDGMTAVAFRGEQAEFLFANSRYYELHGISGDLFRSGHLSDALALVHPDDRERTRRVVLEAARTGQPASMEYRILWPNGAIRWMRATINVTQLIGVDAPVQVTVFADITAIREANDQLRFLNASAHDILAQPDCDLAVNKTLENLLTYFAGDRAYVIELNYERKVSNNTYEICAGGVASELNLLQSVPFAVSAYWFDMFRQGEFVVIPDVTELPDDKSELRALLLSQGIRSLILTPLFQENALFGYAGIDNPTRAVTQLDRLKALADYIAVLLTRRDMLRKIEHDRETMQQLMDDTSGGFLRMAVHKDRRPTIVSFNEGFCRMLRMTGAEVMAAYGADALQCLAAEDLATVRQETAQAVASCGQYTCKCRLRRKNGGLLWVMIFGHCVRGGDGKLFLNSYFTDITERMDEEEKRKALLDNLPVGAALYDFDGKNLLAVHINRQYWKLVGRTPVQYDGTSVLNAIHPEDRAIIMQELAAAIRQRRNAEMNFRILYGESDYKPFHVSASITPADNGHYLLYASYAPISDKAMSVQEMLPIALSAVMSSSSELSFVKDSDQRYICCSQSFADALGLANPRDIIGKSDEELFDSELAQRFNARGARILKGNAALTGIEERFPVRGELRTVSSSLYPLPDASGHAVGLFGICRDMTRERKLTFEFDTLLNVIPSGVLKYAADERGEFAYINRNFIENLGYTRESFREKFHNRFSEMVWHADRERAEREILAQESRGGVGKFDYRIEAADGTLRWFHDEGVKMRDQDGLQWYYVSLTDVTAERNEKERLRLAEEEYRIATRHSGHTIGRYDIAAQTLTISEDAAVRLELPECISDVPYGRVRQGKISPATAKDYIAFYEKIKNGERECSVTFEKLLSMGWRWITERATTIFDEGGKPVSAIISYSDVTEQQEKEAIYKKWQQNLREKGPESYTLYRCNLNKDDAYDSVEGSLLNFHEDQQQSLSFNERARDFAQRCICAEDRERYVSFVNSDTMLASYYRGRRSAELEFRSTVAADDVRWLRLSVELVEFPNTRDIAAYLMYEDINERKLRELQTQAQAQTDPLTGLLNRKTFIRLIDQRLAAQESGALCALFLLDIDTFKQINDRFGHTAGDQALIDTSRAITSVLRESDLVCRMGGDEFLVCLTAAPNREVVMRKAAHIQRLVRSSNHALGLSVSIGIATSPADGVTFEQLYPRADKALYHVKGHGKNGCAFYDESMQAVTADLHSEQVME